jgi:hypothetical protein
MKRLISVGLVAAMLPAAGCNKSAPAGAVIVDVAESKPAVRVEPEAVKTEPVSLESSTAFANDLGRRAVARALSPADAPKQPMGRRTKPLPWHGLTSLEKPEVALALPSTKLISLLPAKAKPPRPRLVAEFAPLIEYTAELEPPQRVDVPPARLVRTPSRDVNLPIELPTQANWKADRASLDDPAAEFALQSAQAGNAPLRDQPAPFVPVNLPEAFPNRASVASPAAEPPVVAPTPQVPK